MSKTFDCISPVNGQVYVTRSYATESEIEHALQLACDAKASWRSVPLSERRRICEAAIDNLLKDKISIGEELAWQMGRPVRYAAGELQGFEERARYMINIAETKLLDIYPAEQAGFRRFIRREPHGLVLSITPWNYPYLTAVNSIIPALMAGNVVVMKTSTQTPLVSERIVAAFEETGLSKGVIQYLHTTHDETLRIIASGVVDYVSFTGSTRGGAEVEHAAAGKFLALGLELGGKDSAYVRQDADIDYAVEGLVEGAYFNSGQSCCSIERIYVQRDIHEVFVEKFVALVKQYKLGNPLDLETTLGPMVSAEAACEVRHQLNNTIHVGAKPWVSRDLFEKDDDESAYLAPQVLTNVEHDMRFMQNESFGPVVGIMAVNDDEQALRLVNESRYGLTASLWTRDTEQALSLGERLQVGTVYMNRCDYLDPALAWSGVKDSGKGCSLSEVGYESLTRPKSFHLRESV